MKHVMHAMLSVFTGPSVYIECEEPIAHDSRISPNLHKRYLNSLNPVPTAVMKRSVPTRSIVLLGENTALGNVIKHLLLAVEYCTTG